MASTAEKTRSVVAKAKAHGKERAQPRKVSDESRLADVIIQADPAAKAGKAATKVQTEARKELLELVNALGEAAPDKEVTVRGTLGAVKFTACGKVTEVTDMRKAHELLGDDLFYELAGINMEGLKAALTLHELRSVTREVAGARRMSVVAAEDLGGLPGQDVVHS